MKPTHVFSPNRALTLPIADITAIYFSYEKKDDKERSHVIAYLDAERNRWMYLQDNLPHEIIMDAVEHWSRAIYDAPDGDSAVLRVDPFVPDAEKEAD